MFLVGWVVGISGGEILDLWESLLMVGFELRCGLQPRLHAEREGVDASYGDRQC